jgi:hypothetical protein
LFSGGCDGRRMTFRRRVWMRLAVSSAVLAVALGCGGRAITLSGSRNPMADADAKEADAVADAWSGGSDAALTGSSGDASQIEMSAASNGAPEAGTVLCGYHTGPIALGTDAGGPALECSPGWECLPLNGAWACCNNGGMPTSICETPF